MGETDCGGNWALAHFGGLQLLVTVTDLCTDMSGNSPFLIWLFYTSPVLWHLLRQGWLNSASQTSVCQMVTLANRWGNNGNRDFTWGEGLQNHCRWWLQPWNSKTLLGRKVMTNLDSMLKSKDITLPTNFHLVKATDFPVVMYGCESWTVKKAEHWRTDAFELWCWRRLLRFPWTARESNQSILKEINLEYSLEWSEAEAPKLWPPDVKNWLIWKDSDAGKDWRQEEKGMTEDEMVGWHYRLDRLEFGQVLGVGDGQGNLACSRPWGHK